MRSANEVKGLRIHAESAGGTLDAQCVLRGFGSPGAEAVTMRALDIAAPGTADLMFPEPIVIKGTFSRCSAEPWLVCSGHAPLTLSQMPTIIS